MPNDLRAWFPKLDSQNHRITSDETPRYNCVAWAANDSSRWWDHVPGYYWPDGLPRDESVEAYVGLFRRLGFELCDNSEPEPGFEKIAVYGKAGKFSHVARLLESGNWTSKLGTLEDIEHDDLDSLTKDLDNSYGQPLVFLRRAKAQP